MEPRVEDRRHDKNWAILDNMEKGLGGPYNPGFFEYLIYPFCNALE